MTDQQKVELLPCPFCGGKPMKGSSYDEDVLLHNIRCRCGAGVNDFFGPEEAIDAWNTRQAAVAHASSEDKGGEVVDLTDDDIERLSLQAGWEGNRKYMRKADFHIWCDRMRAFALLASPRATAEDVRDAGGWREMDSAPIDKLIMGAWFRSPEYTEVLPVIYLSELGKWMNPDDKSDDEYPKPDMWHPYPLAPKHRAIDQAIAGKRGDGNG